MAFLEFRPTRTLYQYCSPDGFIGIITSKSLRFTDLYSANDPREIHLGRNKFIAAINHLANLEADAGRKNYLNVLADQLTTYTKTARPYCACLSMARDQLPMWATYGAGHGGIAIGFRPTALFSIPARIQLIKYVDEASNEDYRDLVAQALREIDTSCAPDNISNTLFPVVDAFALMTAHKHRSWAHEREVRLVHAQTVSGPLPGDHELFSFTGVLPDGQFVKWKPSLTRSGANGPVHYLEFPFGRFKQGKHDPAKAIAEVIVGPKCTMTAEDAVAAMTENGFKQFAVVKSDCQIR